MSAEPQLEVRNLKFEEVDENVPKHWHGGRRSVTNFFDNLSIFFPAGERFFIQSVKAHADAVSDPKLLEDMRSFYGQEGCHSREHVRYNDMLQRHGYDVEGMEGRVIKLLRRVRKYVPMREQLAVTCALEHLTALLADMLLHNPKLLEDAHPEMAALWRWHAAEEMEHKAVAFDVFKAAGGSYPERALVMVAASAIFFAKVFEQQVRIMAKEGTLTSLEEWRSLVRFLCVEPGGLLAAIPKYLDYYRPSFHPWQHDNSELLAAWKAAFAASEDAKKTIAAA